MKDCNEINENGVLRRMEGVGSDGRRVSAHVVASSRAVNGMRYVALWKDGQRKHICFINSMPPRFMCRKKKRAGDCIKDFPETYRQSGM